VTQKKTDGKDMALRGMGQDEAQALFVAGRELHDIAKLTPVTLRTLERWAREGQWEAKRKLAEESPRLLHETLHGILRTKFMKLMNGKLVPRRRVEGIVQFLTLVDRFLGEIWDVRAATLEVMRLFSEFVRRQQMGQEDLGQTSRLLREFFTEVEKRDLNKHSWKL